MSRCLSSTRPTPPTACPTTRNTAASPNAGNWCRNRCKNCSSALSATACANPACVTEGEWQLVFIATQRRGPALSPLPRGKPLVSGQAAPACWHCRKTLHLPPKLEIRHASGPHTVLLNLDACVYPRHLHPHSEDRAPVGQVVQNPQNPQVWGIRNLTATPWTARFPNGEVKEVPPQRAAPLHEGMRLNMGGVEGVVKA